MKNAIVASAFAASMLSATPPKRNFVCDVNAPVAFTHVAVLTMGAPDLLRGQTVVVSNGSISAIGTSVRIPANACRIDGPRRASDDNALRQVNTRMMPGTDCGNPLMICGFAVYDELVALTRDAHFSNYDALRIAMRCSSARSCDDQFSYPCVARLQD